MPRILLTTTSYQDNPGEHHQLLEDADFEIVRERGPLSEEQMLHCVGDIDGFLCGDDAITRVVIDKSLPQLKVISKYGIGLDKIDLDYATEKKIPVLFTPGVNHTTVAEHSMGLLLGLERKIVTEANYTREGNWKRLTGNEIMGRTMGIVGLGRIGKEVAIRAKAFGLKVIAYGNYWDDNFAKDNAIERCDSLNSLFTKADIITLHTKLNDNTRHMIDAEGIGMMKPGVIILNTARGELIDTAAMVQALDNDHVGGYGADVLDQEPPPPDHPLLKAKNCIITPHIGSRTYQSVQRQAGMATRNLINFFDGIPPLAQANDC